MVDVITEIEIDAPKDVVAGYASNPDNAPEWYKNIQSVAWKTPKLLRAGSQVAFTATFLGKQLSYIYEISEFIPGEKLVMHTDKPFIMETTYLWEIINHKTTKMTLRNRGNPTGFSKLFQPFMVSAMKRANKKDLKLLKSIVENKINNQLNEKL